MEAPEGHADPLTCRLCVARLMTYYRRLLTTRLGSWHGQPIQNLACRNNQHILNHRTFLSGQDKDWTTSTLCAARGY